MFIQICTFSILFRFLFCCNHKYIQEHANIQLQQAPTNPLPGARGLPENSAGQTRFYISCSPGSFEYPISVAWLSYQSHLQRIYNLSTRLQCTVRSILHTRVFPQARHQIMCRQSHELRQPISARVDGNLISRRSQSPVSFVGTANYRSFYCVYTSYMHIQ